MENLDMLFTTYETSLATLAPLDISQSVHGTEMNTSMGEITLNWTVMSRHLDYLVQNYKKLASELSEIWSGAAAETTQEMLKKYTAWMSEITNVINIMVNSIVEAYSCYQTERPNVVEPQVILANRAEVAFLGMLWLRPNRIVELNAQYDEYRIQNINVMTLYCQTAAAAAARLETFPWPPSFVPTKSARRSAPESLADQWVSAEAHDGRALVPERARSFWECVIS